MEPLPYLDVIKQVVTVMFSLCFTAIVFWKTVALRRKGSTVISAVLLRTM